MFEATWDRLVLVESLGLARPGWRERVGRRWVEYRAEREPEVRRRLEEAERRREERRREEAARARRAAERKRERLELAREREELLLELSSLVEELARHRLQPGLRAALKEAIGLAKGARTLGELEKTREAAASCIEKAHHVLEEYRELLAEKERLQRAISSVRELAGWRFPASRVHIARELEEVGVLRPKEVPYRLPPPLDEATAILSLGAFAFDAYQTLIKGERSRATAEVLEELSPKGKAVLWEDREGRLWRTEPQISPEIDEETSLIPDHWGAPEILELLRAREGELLEELVRVEGRLRELAGPVRQNDPGREGTPPP